MSDSKNGKYLESPAGHATNGYRPTGTSPSAENGYFNGSGDLSGLHGTPPPPPFLSKLKRKRKK